MTVLRHDVRIMQGASKAGVPCPRDRCSEWSSHFPPRTSGLLTARYCGCGILALVHTFGLNSAIEARQAHAEARTCDIGKPLVGTKEASSALLRRMRA